MKNITLFIFIFVSFAVNTSNINAQQSALQTQYFFQEHIINPSYTGSRTYDPVYLGYRNQWSDFPGSPETFTLGGHYAIDLNHGIGGGFFKDNLGGAFSQTGGQLNYAYHVQINDKGFFSLGAGAIFNQFSGDYSNLDPNDPVTQIGNESKLATDLSLGAHFSSEGLKLGVSVNNLMESSISDYGAVPSDNRLYRQFNILGSYRVDFDSSFALEPMFLLKTIGTTPAQFDATLLAHIKQIFSLGLTYRAGDALAFIAGVQYKKLLFYYSYDMTTSSAQSYTGQTHEITLGTRIPGKGGRISGDKDSDGVTDADDECPDVQGPIENKGCPYGDADGDGLPDNIDKCPQLKGIIELGGCPDRDRDGIADLQDECPDIPGTIYNGGCPEFSQLHVIDNRGRTVTIVNEHSNGEYIVRGIPHNSAYYYLVESRKDEIPNPIYITIVNQEGEHRIEASLGKSGYYEVKKPKVENTDVEDVEEETTQDEVLPIQEEKEEVVLATEERKVVDQAFGELEFENGKSIIKESSYPSLLELVKLLDNNADWKVSFTGHTDNVGEAMFNMLLSKKRAEAVKEFLNQFGVDDNRIVVDFYGETKPISTNDTEEGRSRNRRVDMVLIH